MSDESKSKADEILERRRQRLERLAAKRAAQGGLSPSTPTSAVDKSDISTDSLPKIDDDKKDEGDGEKTQDEILALEKLMQSVVDTNKDDMADEVKLDDRSEDSERKLSININSSRNSSSNSLLSPIKEGEGKESHSHRSPRTGYGSGSDTGSPASRRRTSRGSLREGAEGDRRRASRSSLRSEDSDVGGGRRRSSRTSEILERSERERERRERDRERRERDRERDGERDRDRDSIRSERDRDRDSIRSRDRDSIRSRDRDSIRSRDGDRERERRDRDSIRSRDGDRERERRDRDSIRSRDGDGDRERDRSRERDSDRERFRDRDRNRLSKSQQLSDILASASAAREAGLISKGDGKTSPSERRRSRMEDIEQKLQEVRNRRESMNIKRNSVNDESSSPDLDSFRARAKNILDDEGETKFHREIEEKSKQSTDSPELIALKNRISRLVQQDPSDSLTSPRQKKSHLSASSDDIDPKIKALLSKRSSLDASLIKDLPAMNAPDSDRSLLRKSFQFSSDDALNEKDDSIEYPDNDKSMEMEKSPLKTELTIEEDSKPAQSPIRVEITPPDEQAQETSAANSAIPTPSQDDEAPKSAHSIKEGSPIPSPVNEEPPPPSPQQPITNEYDEKEFDGNYKRLNNEETQGESNENNGIATKPLSEFMKSDMGPEGEDEFWESMITEFKDYFMDIPSYTLQKIRGGIPHHLRGKVWKVMSGADNNQLDTLYDQLLQEESPFEKQILRDVARTFPHMSMFSERKGQGQQMLFNLMKAYSLYDTEVGYCQGLCFIVGPLLMQRLTEKEAFAIFVRLMEETESKPENELEENTEDTRQTRRYAFRSLFTPRMPGVNLMMYQFDYFLKTYLPALYGHLLRHNVVSTMYASQWFLTIFAYNFPLPLVFRIFDILFAEGPGVTILRFSIAILRRNQSRLLEMESFEELLEFLKGNKIFEIYGEGRDAHNDVVNDAMSMCNIICETELRRLRQEFERTDDTNQIANHGGEMELLSARMTLRELRQQRNYDHNLIEELKTQIEILSEEINEARRDVDPLRDENETLRVQCHELKELLTNEDRRLQSIWEDTVRKIEQENAKLKYQLQQAEAQLIDAKVLMANMEEEKDVLVSSIEVLKKAFGANEVKQALAEGLNGSNGSRNGSQHSLRRSDSMASNRSQGGGGGASGWFNNVSNAISNYMEQRQTHNANSNVGSTTGSVDNLDTGTEGGEPAPPAAEGGEQQQQTSRWKFGWGK